MSKFQNSIKSLKNKKAKYSLDETERSENNKTYNDSLYKNKNIYKETTKNENKQKQLNYFLALNTIQDKQNDTFQELNVNELSEIDKLNTKEKNISNYIKKPIIKEIVKIGNILKIIKEPKMKKSIISLPNYNKYNLTNINYSPSPEIDVDEEISSTIINETKSIKLLTISNKKDNNKKNNIITNNMNDNASKDKNKVKEYKNSLNKIINNKIIDKTKSLAKQNNNLKYGLDIINDLEESFDIKVNDYNIKKNRFYLNNNNPSNNLCNKFFGLDKKKFIHKNKNRIFNNRIFKSSDFRNIRKNSINYSIHEIKHIKKWSNVDIALKNKNTKTTTGKKLRKKYERSELKLKKYVINSSNIVNKRYYNNSPKDDIYIKEEMYNENYFNYLTKEKLAKNLIGKFNMCSKGDCNYLFENMMNDINEGSKIDSNNKEQTILNDKVEFIDFFSNESGNWKQNNNNLTPKESSNNNDTFIIKTNKNNVSDLENEIGVNDNNTKKYIQENKYIKNNNNTHNIINKSNDIFSSPQKIREFVLLPYNLKNNKTKLIFKRKNSINENSIFKRNKTQSLINIIPIEPDQNDFLELSDSPSYIDTQSPKIIGNNDKNNKNKIEKNDESQKQPLRTIYDLEFYNNLLSFNKSFKKINFQKIFKNQPLINWEERLNILLWMMKVCEEFAFKRDTYHYSCFYFDLYLFLSKQKIKDKNEFKLIGVTCISISAKIEEVKIPKLKEYTDSIDNYYKIVDIINMEKRICCTLGWKLIPMTISNWLNWYTCQWDLFIDTFNNIKTKILLYSDEDNILLFKRQNEISYYNYRRIYQIIDLIILDYHSYKYEMRHLIAASFLVLICIHYNLDYDVNKKILKKKKKGINLKKSKSLQKYDIGKTLLNIYSQFIERSFDYSFKDKNLNECINYVYKFINFRFSYNIPLIFQIEQDHINDYSYEDFISYQTTCDNIYPFFKDLYQKEFKKMRNKKQIRINNNLPINKSKKIQSSLSKKTSFSNRKSFSSRKSSSTKDNSKNKITNL